MKTYPLAVDLWEDTSSIIVRLTNGTRIATFPLEFVRRGGDNTWEYILNVVTQLVDVVSDLPKVLMDEEGQVVSLDDAPWAGTFRFEQVGQLMSPTFGLRRTANQEFVGTTLQDQLQTSFFQLDPSISPV
jgi:hypothetical protein